MYIRVNLSASESSVLRGPDVRLRIGRSSDRRRPQVGRGSKTAILPKAISLKAYQGGQADYLRVLAAQRVVAESDLEWVRGSGEMWQAAGEIAGLMMEDNCPERRYP